MRNQRLERILIERGLVKGKHDAFVAVTEGKIFVDGQKAVSPAQLVKPEAKIEFRGGLGYVGRGALKCEAALESFKMDIRGKICADIGAATGGFTEVLLRHGARKVYAIDTARGKLALKLREDPRVIVLERKDVRDIEFLPDPIRVAVIDVSLIPLEEILPQVRRFLSEDGCVVALFKPQYQTGDKRILKHGILTDKDEREKLLENFLQWAEERAWKILGSMESPIKGSEGNVEYLVYLQP